MNAKYSIDLEFLMNSSRGEKIKIMTDLKDRRKYLIDRWSDIDEMTAEEFDKHSDEMRLLEREIDHLNFISNILSRKVA